MSEVRSAMTTVTPTVKAALICSTACSAVVALIWAGRVTMTGGAQEYGSSSTTAWPQRAGAAACLATGGT